MHHGIRNILLIVLCLGPVLSKAQKVYLQFRQPEFLLYTAVTAFDDTPYKQYGSSLAIEYVPQNSKSSLTLNLAYAYHIDGYSSFYYNNGDKASDFYEEGYTIGVLGRYYLIDKNLKIYGEVGLYYNRSVVNQAIKIRANYNGLYEEYISGGQNIYSSTISAGISLPLFWGWRYEPYMQYTLATQHQIGRPDPLLATSPYSLFSFNFMVFPASFKVPIFNTNK